MSYISKRKFKELAAVSYPHCISVYLTTEKGQMDGNRILLKNSLTEVKRKLEAFHLKGDQIASRTGRMEALFDDLDFWKSLSGGLALFGYDEQLEIIISEHAFSAEVFVAGQLHLLGLVNLLDNRKNFYLLVLGANNVRFFKGNDDQIDQLEIDDLPDRIEEVIGSDVRQKALQYRSGQGEAEGGMYHGQGSGSDTEKKKELAKFFRAIDHVLSKEMDPEEEIPLIVASEERSFHLYKELNSYPFLWNKPIQGNHESTKKSELHRLGLECVKNQPTEVLDTTKRQFNALLNKGKSSSEVFKVVGASYYGQVAKLLINQEAKLFGHFSPDTNEVTIHEKPNTSSVDLLDFSAVHTLLKDGQVFLLKKEDMPDPTSPVNAVFRYEVVSP